MKYMGILIPVIFTLILFGALGGICWVVLKKFDPKNADSSENSSAREAQAFLPFSTIGDNMIVLPNRQYRMVLECNSLNYNLKTDAERDQIEMSFQRFLNTISFPVTFFLQTKIIDNRDRLRKMDERLEDVLRTYPGLKSYAMQYRYDLEHLNAQIGNTHQKKRYLIVTYNDAEIMDSLSEEEQELYAKKELLTRCNTLISGLESVGVSSYVMNTQQLMELVYSCYYRDDYTYAEQLTSGEAFSLFVDGIQDRFKNLDKRQALSLLCGEAINRINLENLDQTEDGAKLLTFLRNLDGASQRTEDSYV